jgi:hypothetical protein
MIGIIITPKPQVEFVKLTSHATAIGSSNKVSLQSLMPLKKRGPMQQDIEKTFEKYVFVYTAEMDSAV